MNTTSTFHNLSTRAVGGRCAHCIRRTERVSGEALGACGYVAITRACNSAHAAQAGGHAPGLPQYCHIPITVTRFRLLISPPLL